MWVSRRCTIERMDFYSNSFIGVPIFFIPKKDGSIRFYVNYYALNAIIIKDRCLLPLINKTLNCLCSV